MAEVDKPRYVSEVRAAMISGVVGRGEAGVVVEFDDPRFGNREIDSGAYEKIPVPGDMYVEMPDNTVRVMTKVEFDMLYYDPAE